MNLSPNDFPHKIHKYSKKPTSPFHNIYIFPIKRSTQQAVEVKFQVLPLVTTLFIAQSKACDLV